MFSFFFPVIFRWVLDLRFWWTELCPKFNLDRFKVQTQPTDSIQSSIQTNPAVHQKNAWGSFVNVTALLCKGEPAQQDAELVSVYLQVLKWIPFRTQLLLFFWGRARSWGRKRVFVLLLLAPLSVDSRLNIVKYRTLPAPSLPVNEKIETQKRREKSIRTSVDTSKVFVLGAHSPFRHACSFGIEITMEIEVDRTPA